MRPVRTVFRNAEIPGRIAEMRPFLSEGRLPDGTRRWSGHFGPPVSFGHLPARLHASARLAIYVVYSYETPIAWVTEGADGRRTELVYHVPDVGYSPTTGQQQYACLDAWREQARRGEIQRHGRREVVRVPGNAEVYGQERRLHAGGMDGHRPDPVADARENGYRLGGPADGYPERRSAYEDTGDDASHWSPGPNAPGGYGPWERPGDWGWHPAAHP